LGGVTWHIDVNPARNELQNKNIDLTNQNAFLQGQTKQRKTREKNT
jgi:hypothetical protein